MTMLLGLLRVRNEAEILRDSLDHLAGFCDGVVVFDDASTDETALVARAHPAVLDVIQGAVWEGDRLGAETSHRAALAKRAQQLGSEWVAYADADERFTIDVRALIENADDRVDGFRLGLLDGYLTDKAAIPYSGGRLEDLDRLFGVEERRILMIWRQNGKFHYLGRDQREPVAALHARIVEVPASVKHFGKCLSIAQWERKCDYYAAHFPEPYRTKWIARRGRAIHTLSDFDTRLVSWEDAARAGVLIDNSPPTLRHRLRRLQATGLWLRGRLVHRRTTIRAWKAAKGIQQSADVANLGE